MGVLFGDCEGVILSEYLETGTTLNSERYVNLLDKLHTTSKEKRRGTLSKHIVFLQDNAPCHKAAITMHKLCELKYDIIDHPPYSPYLAPSDYYLFPKLKMHLKVLNLVTQITS